MPIERTYQKDSEGKVTIIETVVKDPIVKDLHELKERKAFLEQEIIGRRNLYIQQRTIELDRAAQTVDDQIAAWQAELESINADIAGAEQAGVKDIPTE